MCLRKLRFAFSSFVIILCLISVDGQREEINGLFPVVFNLATNALITTNATCGEAGQEVFCKLVEHVRIFPAENRQCDICDANSHNLKQRHPITNAIDGSQKWWQSPTLTNGAEYNHVTITLDLRQMYQIAYVIVKAANAPRPGNWILERSTDGVTYSPWQYFAMTDKECEDIYRIRATVGVPAFQRDDEVICTSRHSALNPLQDGEIFVSLVNGRPGVFQASRILMDFTTARYVRLRFQKIRTLNADLMSFRRIDPKEVDSSVTRRYYYSIKDISIGGQCICYGHASNCRRHDHVSDRLQCQCLHNTAGDNCEKCLPLFNQKPWQVGGLHYTGCEECNCHGKSDECIYNATVDALKLSVNTVGRFDGGGVCLNCREYTTGINCERCLPGYYRPQGMTQSMRYPCRPCTCQETQTSTANCVPNDRYIASGLNPGDCFCKEGYGGPTCTSCADGYIGYPNCQRCHCNPAGSVDPSTCGRVCTCKTNVQGSGCDQCKQGFFNLDKNNPDGCSKCFCFGVTNVCESVGWGLGKIDTLDSWILTTVQSGGLTLLPRYHNGWLEAKTYLQKIDPRSYSQDDIHYWLAPGAYLGNKLSSYGGYLQFNIRYSLDGHSYNRYHLSEPNIVLEGLNMSISSDKQMLRETVENVIRIHLHESNWYHLNDRRPVTREELMTVLYSLHRLLIRATYHTAQDTVYLKDVSLDLATPEVMDGSSLATVEKCMCPDGYAGLSCESCCPGWRRINNRLFGGVCQKCECYNHASQCDPVSGQCLDCKHNTVGDKCDRCLPGYIGDPRHGNADDCKPCACPLPIGSNFFAERCVARPTVQDQNAYECLNCREGYTGTRCEMCAPNYFGNPTIPGGSCRLCSCGGVVVGTEPRICNNVTGACFRCGGNTEGDHCEKCRSGFYGSAANGDCRPCDCYEGGSNNLQCHPQYGQCSCRERYTGQKCDRCQPGYGNIERGCVRCSCDRAGSERSECDPVTGQCRCKPGVGGLSCDRCDQGHYDFSRTGCKRCDCYTPGTSNNNDCDSQSGRCVCKQGVTGPHCDICQSRHFGLESGQGCSPCDCNRTGSADSLCDPQTGQCQCLPGVTGRSCDHCLPDYYGLFSGGCHRCEPCDKKGHICDAISGKCVCPPNTEGPNCEFCITDGWGYDKNGGCKKNVEGPRCDKCRQGTFSLSKDNPKGCTECYCFHRAHSCQQAPYVWAKLDLPNQSVNLDRNEHDGKMLVRMFGHFVINDSHTYVPDDLIDRPLYWQIASTLQSDMILSYNGKLQFFHYFEGPTHNPGIMTNAPLVIIVGNGIQIQTGISSLEPQNPALFDILLHEDHWYQTGHRSPISRGVMMIVLQNVEAIFIRAVQDGRATFAELGPISIQRAVPPGPNVDSTEVAVGVELCQCPEQYSGESCQNPGSGYHRIKPPNVGPDTENPDTIIGVARPCRCHGHSNVCHPDTGQCLECQHNTAGFLCEKCADGFYGVATRGTISDCVPCSCPLPFPSNNFSPTCIGDQNGMICNACRKGYTGIHCESCAPGFYGNPEKVGDTCKLCNCNPDGSSSHICDTLSGQCPCLQGIGGLKCDACSDPTFGVINGVCVSCYTGCTGILLADLANMSIPLIKFNFSDASYPWEKLFKIEKESNDLKIKLDLLRSAGLKDLIRMEHDVKYYDSFADTLINRLSTTGTEASRTKNSAAELLKNATELEEIVSNTFRDIKKLVEGLDELVERLIYNQSGVNMTAALENAKKILDEILSRNFSSADKAAWRENMLAEKLSEKIRDLGLLNLNGTQVENKLNDLKMRLNDLVYQTELADDTVNQALRKIEELKNLLKKLKGVKNEIKRLHEDSESILQEARDLLNIADKNLATSTGNTELMDIAMHDLANKVENLRNVLPGLRQLSADAIEHAKNLRDQAAQLDGLFAGTRNLSENAVKAAGAYKSIIDAINEAKKSANEAVNAAKTSVELIEVKGLKDEVLRLKMKSEEQDKMAKDLLKTARDLVANLSRVLLELDDANSKLKNNRKILNDIQNMIDMLPTDIQDRIDEINRKNRDTKKITQDALDIVKNINETEMSKLKAIKDLNISNFNFDIEAETSRVKEIVSSFKELDDLEKKVTNKAQNAWRKLATIGHDLTQLKEKIQTARNIVNDMKISLLADGQCFRSYRSTLKPSSTNEIRFSFKLNNTMSDMLLMLLQQSPQQKDMEFMAAEIKNQKVVFSWDSGKGRGSVIHNESLTVDKWYKVVLKRLGSVGQLKVWNLEESSEQSAIQMNSFTGAGCSLLNMNENSTIFIAGSDNLYQIPNGITRSNFTGCLGEITLDGQSLGVYNFKRNVLEHCGACKEVPRLQVGANKNYVFNGQGYAGFKIKNYNSNKTRVEVEFKTFWEDSRIYFVGNAQKGDYLSLELKGGHVVLQLYLGGKNVTRFQTNKTYNYNQWTKVIFERNKLQAALTVGDDSPQVFKILGDKVGLDLDGALIYFGGVPETLKEENFKELKKSENFFGCMKNFKFGSSDDEDGTLFDVQVSLTCRENGIHTVDFKGDGYLILQNKTLDFNKEKNDFSLTFVTQKEDNIIFIARDISAENYYSLSMVNGYLEVRIMSEGHQQHIIRSTKKFNDGKTHCVSIIKDNGVLELVVDDQPMGSTNVENVIFTRGSDLYLGGPPPSVDDIAATNKNMDGCISDVIVNGILLSMSDAQQYKRADIGRCRFTAKTLPVIRRLDYTPAPTVVDTLAADDPYSCASETNIEFELDAKSVGNSASFFADITKLRKEDIAKNFNFSFDFRTYYPDGLFGYLVNKDKSYYFGIQLHNSKLEVIYVYNEVTNSITFPASRLSDGQWHSVFVEKSNTALKVSYDKENFKTKSIDELLDFEIPLHLGGPQKPEDFEDYKIPLVTHSIRGCIRSLKVNGRNINITDTSVIQDVSGCFKNVEAGAYFDGESWGAFNPDFVLEPRYTMSLQFKTTSKSGVLLSASSRQGYGLTLELHGGKVKLSFKNANGVFRAVTTNDNLFVFCDNKWHQLRASLFDGKLMVSVDNEFSGTLTAVGTPTKITTDYPLFIGGFPETIKQTASLSADMFFGCLRNLVLNGAPVDWYTLPDMKGIRKNACPIS